MYCQKIGFLAIDIFFHDRQFLSFVSPRVNDGVESTLVNYTEQTNFTFLSFEEGEIDFIVAALRTGIKPFYKKNHGDVCLCRTLS